MADFYVCKYALKYVSELIYAFELLEDLRNRQDIKILSFGCGPCTDLLALDFMRKRSDYIFSTLEYRGVDYGRDVWHNIHNDLSSLSPSDMNVRFFYSDAREIINQISARTWVPNLVIFQYFFSDMNKNATVGEISAFVNTFAEYANYKMPNDSYIVLNDINLSTAYGGGREYFDRLLTLMNNGLYDKGHFHNNTRPNTYEYGRKFDTNDLFFDVSPLAMYRPFGSCSSAQMIFKKGGA